VTTLADIPTQVPIAPDGKGQRFLRQYELVDLVKAYDPSASEALLNKAYVYSVQAHGQQLRHSGDPYYAHPIEVAGIVASLKLDVATICTALLHDVLEDTETSREDLAREFTPEIADLVNGVTKLGKVEMSRPNLSKERAQAENFQKFILAVSKDIRVLLVKLCDRLHNMRTLQYHPKPESRERIARETLEIYAPLARRIGVDKICSELEDLSFQHMNPAAYEGICRRLEAWRSLQGEAISQIFTALKTTLTDADVEVRLYGREKRAYAIWKKLQRQNISFDDVADIYAFRVIVEKWEDCYKVLGILHDEYRAVPSRFRDFISVPKPNGYQSLHTTIRTSENRRAEIQIRTERMEDVAQRGVAAHWAYKDQSYSYDPTKAQASGGDPLKRIRTLIEMMDQSGDADEFLDNVKLEMFTDQVFTFTPKGDLIALPRGATPIDFAYAVHTGVGDTCIGAVVNGREVPLRTQLRNGDVIKIIRGGTAEPQPGWENIVVTGRARQALRRLTRTGEAENFKNIGETLAHHAFKREGLSLEETVLTDALRRLQISDEDTLFADIGRGHISMSQFVKAVFPAHESVSEDKRLQDLDLIDDESIGLYVKGDSLIPGKGLYLAECCSPIAGDRIVGLQEKGKGIVIHTIDCEELVHAEDEMENWIDLGWRRAAKQAASTGRVIATVQNTPGALADVTKIIGESQGNLSNINTVRRSPAFFDMIFDIEVRDNRHLMSIVAAIRASAYVVKVNRSRALPAKLAKKSG